MSNLPEPDEGQRAVWAGLGEGSAVDDPDSAMLVLSPGRWIAWSDSD
ncbi:MAG TPA: hypothetical protein VF163_01710 [Micromonosporaceae bacterium]